MTKEEIIKSWELQKKLSNIIESLATSENCYTVKRIILENNTFVVSFNPDYWYGATRDIEFTIDQILEYMEKHNA